MAKILIVDDDRDLVDLETYALRRHGFDALGAFDSPNALKLFETENPDLVVLDVLLGEWNGFNLLKELRTRSTVPIIMLTARDDEEDCVLGLSLGADDYITKPFSYRELVARIEAQLRRSSLAGGPAARDEKEIEVGPLRMNVALHEATLSGKRLNLTPTEFRLLAHLATRAGTVVPTRVLLRDVFHGSGANGSHVARVVIHRLRAKLGDDAKAPRLIHTIAGVGFSFNPDQATAESGQQATPSGV